VTDDDKMNGKESKNAWVRINVEKAHVFDIQKEK